MPSKFASAYVNSSRVQGSLFVCILVSCVDYIFLSYYVNSPESFHHIHGQCSSKKALKGICGISPTVDGFVAFGAWLFVVLNLVYVADFIITISYYPTIYDYFSCSYGNKSRFICLLQNSSSTVMSRNYRLPFNFAPVVLNSDAPYCAYSRHCLNRVAFSAVGCG